MRQKHVGPAAEGIAGIDIRHFVSDRGRDFLNLRIRRRHRVGQWNTKAHRRELVLKLNTLFGRVKFESNARRNNQVDMGALIVMFFKDLLKSCRDRGCDNVIYGHFDRF